MGIISIKNLVHRFSKYGDNVRDWRKDCARTGIS